EDLLQLLEAVRRIALAGGGEEGLEIRMVRHSAAGGEEFEGLVDVAHEAAVVEVASVVFESVLEEAAVIAFFEVVEAELAAVEGDDRVGDAGRGHPGGPEELAAEQLLDVGRVLGRVVEVELAHAVE